VAEWGFEALHNLWLIEGGPKEWANTMAAIALAESGGCTLALAGPVDIRPEKRCVYRHTTAENSVGLWQINVKAHPQYPAASLFDARANVRAAIAVLGHGTPTPWTTYTSGAYKGYLGGKAEPGGADHPFPITLPPGPTGPVGQPKRVTAAWHFFVKEMATTAPTQMRRARVASGRYKYAVKGSGPPRSGLVGPVGKKP